MNKFLRVLFFLVILAMTGAIIFQLAGRGRLVFGMWQSLSY